MTDIDYVTYDSEDVIVYVNDANQPVSTTTGTYILEMILPSQHSTIQRHVPGPKIAFSSPKACLAIQGYLEEAMLTPKYV